MADEDVRAQLKQTHEYVMKLGEKLDEKLDVITDIMLSLARSEERQVAIIAHNERQDRSIDDNKKAIENVAAQLDGPNGIHTKVARLMGVGGAVVLVGVWVINYYFAHQVA